MIEATSPNIVLPEDVQAAVLGARNNVSLLEAEAGRLERLISSQKRELVSLDGALNDIKSQLDTITQQRIEVVKEISILTESRDLIRVDINDITLRNNETRAEIDRREADIAERENTLAQAEQRQQEAVISLTERTKYIEKEEGIIASKKLTLSEAIAQL